MANWQCGYCKRKYKRLSTWYEKHHKKHHKTLQRKAKHLITTTPFEQYEKQ